MIHYIHYIYLIKINMLEVLVIIMCGGNPVPQLKELNRFMWDKNYTDTL